MADKQAVIVNSTLEAIMTDAMFELPSDDSIKEFKVTLSYAREKVILKTREFLWKGAWLPLIIGYSKSSQ